MHVLHRVTLFTISRLVVRVTEKVELADITRTYTPTHIDGDISRVGWLFNVILITSSSLSLIFSFSLLIEKKGRKGQQIIKQQDKGELLMILMIKVVSDEYTTTTTVAAVTYIFFTLYLLCSLLLYYVKEVGGVLVNNIVCNFIKSTFSLYGAYCKLTLSSTTKRKKQRCVCVPSFDRHSRYIG